MNKKGITPLGIAVLIVGLTVIILLGVSDFG